MTEVRERERETDRQKIREHPFEMGHSNNVHILFEMCVHIVLLLLLLLLLLPRAQKYVNFDLSTS